MDSLIQHALDEMAADLGPSPGLPAKDVRRARLKATATFLSGLIVTIGVVGSGYIFAQRLGAEPTRISSGSTPNSSGWRGIWPHASRREANEAQRLADSGEPSVVWQLDGESVVLRFTLEELSWEASRIVSYEVFNEAAGPIRFVVIRCDLEEKNRTYPEEECAPTAASQDTFDQADIRVEKLVDRGPKGVWTITDIGRGELHQGMVLSVSETRQLVREFMTRRIEGSGAESFLSAAGERAFMEGNLNPLYGAYEAFEVEAIDGPLWPEGAYEVGVSISLEGGSRLEETLFLGPSENSGEGQEMVVGGRTGLSGP